MRICQSKDQEWESGRGRVGKLDKNIMDKTLATLKLLRLRLFHQEKEREKFSR